MSHNDSVNSMVQSIGQFVWILYIFFTYLRLQTEPLFLLKADFYKLNGFSPLLGWENPFFLHSFLFQHPRILYLYLFHDTPRRGSQVLDSHRELGRQKVPQAEQGRRVREAVLLPVLKAALWGPWDMPTFTPCPGAGPRILLSTTYSSLQVSLEFSEGPRDGKHLLSSVEDECTK